MPHRLVQLYLWGALVLENLVLPQELRPMNLKIQELFY